MTSPRIPYENWSALYRSERDAVLVAVDAALTDEDARGSAVVGSLEERVAECASRAHAVAVGSGTEALTIALRSAGVRPGDEVIVPALSFVASASAVVLAGCRPVFVDIDPETCMVNVDRLDSALTGQVSAMVAVQLYGRCMPAAPVERFAAQHGLRLVEDAAQAFGAVSPDGRPAGAFGLVSTFSFNRSKPLSGIGNGGMVLTDDEAVHAAARRLRSHGRDPASDEFREIGYNSALPAANAAVLLHRLDRQKELLDRRIYIRDRYHEGLAGLPLRMLPSSSSGPGNEHRFVVRTLRRDDLRRHLAGRGIITKVHYDRVLPDHPALAKSGRVVGDLLNARRAAGEVLSLPNHTELDDHELDRVISAIRDFFEP